MSKKRTPRPRPAPARLIAPDLDKLQSMMMDYAERKPSLEAPILRMAKECGLVHVVTRIQRLRSYARSHKGK